jgi:nicotinamidase-related amidase
MTQIAAEPGTIGVDLSRTALLIIDMQRDFLEPGGFGETLGNNVSLLKSAVEPCRQVLAAARKAGILVIHTREGHSPDMHDAPPAKVERGAPSLRIGDPGPMGRILIAGEPGADIVPALAAKPGEIVLDKPGKGAFYGTKLSAILAERKITHLMFAGVTTEVCVQTTMREANDRGFDCLLAEDATESYFPEFKKATLEMIRAQGAIVGWTATVDQIAKALK